MPQGTEITAGINVSHGTNALGIVPHPDSDFILPGAIFNRRYFHIHPFPVPLHFQDDFFAAAFLYQADELILLVYGSPVDFPDIISGFQYISTR